MFPSWHRFSCLEWLPGEGHKPKCEKCARNLTLCQLALVDPVPRVTRLKDYLATRLAKTWSLAVLWAQVGSESYITLFFVGSFTISYLMVFREWNGANLMSPTSSLMTRSNQTRDMPSLVQSKVKISLVVPDINGIKLHIFDNNFRLMCL